MQKNNKGFSLVELIVVILIMAILGVALTPQVMKWVNNSRISSDLTNYDALVSAAQLTLANEDVYTAIKGESTNDIIIKMNATDVDITFNSTEYSNTTPAGTLKTFGDVFSANLPDYKKLAAKALVSSLTEYTITVKHGTCLIEKDSHIETAKTTVKN